MNNISIIKSGKKPFKKIYLSLFLWFLGRAIVAASKVDDEIKKEFDCFPDGFMFSLGTLPNGPHMIIGKKENGAVEYLGSKNKDLDINVKFLFKHIEAFFLAFTFQESTPTANAFDRIIVEGPIPEACAVNRILSIVQTYLLPKPIVKLAIKRYPSWSIKKHVAGSSMVYLRTITGI